MQELALLLLTALADAPRHGYAVAQEVKAITDGRVVPRTGALYGALDRLLAEGLIQVEREEVVGGRARRIRSCPAGRSGWRPRRSGWPPPPGRSGGVWAPAGRRR